MNNNISSLIRKDEHTQKGIVSSFRFFIIITIYWIIRSLMNNSFSGYLYLLLIIFPLVGFLTSLVLNRMDFKGEKIGLSTKIVIYLISSIVSSLLYIGAFLYLANMFEYTEIVTVLSITLDILLGTCFQNMTISSYISGYNLALEEFNFFDYISPGSEDLVFSANKKIELLRDRDIYVDQYNIIYDLAKINKKLNQETAFYFSTTLTNYIPNLIETLDLIAKATKETDRDTAILLSKDIISRIESEIHFYEDTESQVKETLKEKELEVEEDSFEERIEVIKKSLS